MLILCIALMAFGAFMAWAWDVCRVEAVKANARAYRLEQAALAALDLLPVPDDADPVMAARLRLGRALAGVDP